MHILIIARTANGDGDRMMSDGAEAPIIETSHHSSRMVARRALLSRLVELIEGDDDDVLEPMLDLTLGEQIESLIESYLEWQGTFGYKIEEIKL